MTINTESIGLSTSEFPFWARVRVRRAEFKSFALDVSYDQPNVCSAAHTLILNNSSNYHMWLVANAGQWSKYLV